MSILQAAFYCNFDQWYADEAGCAAGKQSAIDGKDLSTHRQASNQQRESPPTHPAHSYEAPTVFSQWVSLDWKSHLAERESDQIQKFIRKKTGN